jgi:hypothetical protein
VIPSLVFELICIIILLIVYTVESIIIVVSAGEYGLIIVPIFVIIFWCAFCKPTQHEYFC